MLIIRKSTLPVYAGSKRFCNKRLLRVRDFQNKVRKRKRLLPYEKQRKVRACRSGMVSLLLWTELRKRLFLIWKSIFVRLRAHEIHGLLDTADLRQLTAASPLSCDQPKQSKRTDTLLIVKSEFILASPPVC